MSEYWYGQEDRNRVGHDATRVEIGVQGLTPVPVVETRMLAGVGDDH